LDRFQWVRCQLDSLCRAISDKAIRTALKDLPVGLDDTYIRIFKRLQEDFPGEIDIVKRIFFWITHSMRPLAVEELAEALFFTEDNGSLDLSSVPTDPLDLLKFGGSLLTLTDGKKIIGLSHFSVKEFLLSKRIRKSAVSDFYADEALTHHDIVDTSLSYLIMKDFNSGQCINQKRLEARFESFQYLRYGASHWMDHYKKLDNTDTEALDQRVFQFFTDTNMKGNVLAWQQIEENWGDQFGNRYWKYQNPVYPFGRTGKPGGVNLSLSINPIYYAAYYGIWPLAKLLLDTGHDPNGQGGHFKYPVLAAAFGQISTWEFIDKFIKAGADINVYSNKGSVAYANATLGAPQDWWLLKDLAIAGAEINEYHPFDESSILSIIAGHPSQPLQMVEILLKHGACPNDSQAHDEDAMYGLHYATPLQNSVKSNNPAITQALLDAGADINLPAGDLGTPLQVAIRFKYPETARFLIEKGADVNIAGGIFGSPLQAAAWSGDMSILQLLIDNGSNVDTPGGISGCALSAAIARRHNDAIETLLRQNPDVNSGEAHDFYEYEDMLNDLSLDTLTIGLSTPLNWAVFYQDLAMIERLISLGTDLNAPLQRCSAGSRDFTFGSCRYHPLCLALDDGNSEIIELLLERGADPSIGDFCAAMVAASKDQFELFTLFIKEAAAGPSLEKILLEALIYTRSLGLDFERNLFNLIGQKLFDENEEVAIGALRAAITAGSEMKVRGLLLCGANVESEAESRYFRRSESYLIRKPLLLAISPNREAINQNKKAIVDILLDHGVDVNVFSEHCGTPLGLAVEARDSELTTKLLSHGANFSQPCWKNISCGNIFHLAVQSGDLQVVDILLQWGAKVTQQCDYCPTALSCAVTSEHCEMIRKLVRSGGDVNERDFYGHSILQRAREAHLDEAVALLLSLGADSDSSSDGLSSHLESSIRHLTQKLSIQLNTENFELPQQISSRRWMILGNCLFLGNDPRNAIIALEQSLPVDDSAKTSYHSLHCKRRFGRGSATYHFCKSGDTMIWCEEWCVETHWHYLKDLDACETHEYLRYPRVFFRDIPDGDVALDRDTFIPREKWLESLKGWIFKEKEDPDVLLCSELGVWSQ
jgi:ankyrin repeat protein